MVRSRTLLVLSTMLLAGAGVAGAEVWTITLENGTTFESRYRPEAASWDPDVTMVSTDQGNWIGLATDDIVDVVSESESSGFGYRLDTTTLFLGWSPNDLVETDEEGNEVPRYAAPPLPQQDFSVQQFIDIPVVGQGGAPASGIPTFESLGGGPDSPPGAAPPAGTSGIPGGG